MAWCFNIHLHTTWHSQPFGYGMILNYVLIQHDKTNNNIQQPTYHFRGVSFFCLQAMLFIMSSLTGLTGQLFSDVSGMCRSSFAPRSLEKRAVGPWKHLLFGHYIKSSNYKSLTPHFSVKYPSPSSKNIPIFFFWDVIVNHEKHDFLMPFFPVSVVKDSIFQDHFRTPKMGLSEEGATMRFLNRKGRKVWVS